MAALMMMGCTGNKSTNLNDIPETRVYNHCDTLLIACRNVGDYQRMLTVADSLADKGEMSAIHAAVYQCEAYFYLDQKEKSLDCLRQAIASSNPPAKDFWYYIICGQYLAMLQDGVHDFEGVMTTSQRFIKELQQVNTPYCDRWLNSFYFYIGHTQMSLQHQKEAAESFDEAYRCTIRGFDNDTTGISMPTAMLTFSNIATSYFSFDMTDKAARRQATLHRHQHRRGHSGPADSWLCRVCVPSVACHQGEESHPGPADYRGCGV